MRYFYLIILICFLACNKSMEEKKDPYIVVLGTAQDAGYPQANCNRNCCANAWENLQNTKYVSCIALVDPVSNQQWLIDATPDIKFQLRLLEKQTKINPLNGIFITHAHIGHYAGLMQLGREVIGTKNMPVYVMKRMKSFIKRNAPWNQLIKIKNILLKDLENQHAIQLNKRIKITPFLVPHRDEYSETVGYRIETKKKTLIYIPDIDKWHDWDTDISNLITNVDYALLDGTFYQDGELERDMSEIPHPFVKETMDLFSKHSKEDKQKIYFIHLNHTNPLLIDGSAEQKEVIELGFNIAKQGNIITL